MGTDLMPYQSQQWPDTQGLMQLLVCKVVNMHYQCRQDTNKGLACSKSPCERPEAYLCDFLQ